MKESVFVTGGAGYIGSILVADLLAAGYRVHVLDNFMYNQASLNHLVSDPLLTVSRGDVRDLDAMSAGLRGADIVIPLAALVGAPLCNKDPFTATAVNKDAVFGMIKLLGRDQLVLMPTTNSGYGTSKAGEVCTEASPLNPISRYARDKVEVEERLMELPNAVSLRLATVFGMSPRMRLDLLVNDFCYRALTDAFIVLFESEFTRNYIHVRDVSKAFRHVIENAEQMRGEVYNVGLSDANISKRGLCEKIKLQLPNFQFLESSIGSDPDQRDYNVSNEKIEATGFAPEFSLDAGISELIKGLVMLRNRVYSNI
jgi:nucleoside-diphosphate-sugar epimerase